MRTIVHLSDLHFGRVDAALLAPLVDAVAAACPDLVAVSGDLTQRARSVQFREARAFLDRLPTPQIVVPGNHDVPLYDVLRRFAAPLRRFRQHISHDLAPFYRDDEIAVIGINTARSLTFKSGRINARQVSLVAQRFAGLPDSILRIVVTHHPFDLPGKGEETDIVGRSASAMRAFAECGVDLFLSGHLHQSHIGNTTERYAIAGHSALIVHAGTASSTRGRGESNAFNVIRAERARIDVETWSWEPDSSAFVMQQTTSYRKQGTGWLSAS
ncbi:MAG: metallophosphoesterase family protein [Luteimonas sp.]